MKATLGLITILILAMGVKAQQSKCSAKVSDLPAVRGISLGMPKEDLLKLIRPESRTMVTEVGSIYDYNFGKPEEYEGWRRFEFSSFEGRVKEFEIEYRATSDWSGTAEFSRSVADQLGLARYSFIYDDILNSYSLECDGFKLQVSFLKIRLLDNRADKLKKEAEAADAEKRRKAFKI